MRPTAKEAMEHPFFSKMYVFLNLTLKEQGIDAVLLSDWTHMLEHSGPRNPSWMPSVLGIHPAASIDMSILVHSDFTGDFVPSSNDQLFVVPKTSPKVDRPETWPEQCALSVYLCARPTHALDNVPSWIAQEEMERLGLSTVPEGLELPVILITEPSFEYDSDSDSDDDSSPITPSLDYCSSISTMSSISPFKTPISDYLEVPPLNMTRTEREMD